MPYSVKTFLKMLHYSHFKTRNVKSNEFVEQKRENNKLQKGSNER